MWWFSPLFESSDQFLGSGLTQSDSFEVGLQVSAAIKYQKEDINFSLQIIPSFWVQGQIRCCTFSYIGRSSFISHLVPYFVETDRCFTHEVHTVTGTQQQWHTKRNTHIATPVRHYNTRINKQPVLLCNWASFVSFPFSIFKWGTACFFVTLLSFFKLYYCSSIIFQGLILWRIEIVKVSVASPFPVML